MKVQDSTPTRCRLIVIVDCQKVTPKRLDEALDGGDVACAIFFGTAVSDGVEAKAIEDLVKLTQDKEVAAIIAHDSQFFGRSGADGIYLESRQEELKDAVARFSPQKIVGCGKIKQKHVALEIGELQPDFVFFGKLEGDIKPEPHPKNVALGNWWSELIEIPCVVMGGNSLDSVVACAESGAEFVGLKDAVFEHSNPLEAVQQANALLDKFAPSFEEEGG